VYGAWESSCEESVDEVDGGVSGKDDGKDADGVSGIEAGKDDVVEGDSETECRVTLGVGYSQAASGRWS
jgi:hypothetical protein